MLSFEKLSAIFPKHKRRFDENQIFVESGNELCECGFWLVALIFMLYSFQWNF